MHRGLTMPEDEKARRHEQLYKTVTTHTSHTWATMLAKKLPELLGSSNTAPRTPFIPKYELEWHCDTARKQLFFEYDGTLAPIVKMPSAAVRSADVAQALETLTADPRNVVYIISRCDRVPSAASRTHLQPGDVGGAWWFYSVTRPEGVEQPHRGAEHKLNERRA